MLTMLMQGELRSNESQSFLRKIFYRTEQIRLRRHLSKVENELRSSNVQNLTALQRERRIICIKNLHKYLKSGIFPKNTLYKHTTPIFQDEYGTLCAMAHLINESGGVDLVREVSMENNTVKIGDLRDGPILDWIDQYGLTQEESARIQPTYHYCDSNQLCIIVYTLTPWIVAFLSYMASGWAAQRFYHNLPQTSGIKRYFVIGILSLLCLFVAFFLYITSDIIISEFFPESGFKVQMPL